jgi:hypothetical protein
MRRDRAAAAAAILGLGALTAAAPPARGGVLSEDPLAETSTEAGVIARTFTFVLAGKALEPPLSPTDMDPTGEGIADLRLYVAKQTPTLKLVVHDALTSTVRAHGTLGGIAVGRGVAPPRWLPLSFTLADDPTITVRDAVDWAYAAWSHGPVTVTLGRQPISFGRARLWSPMDLVGPFALTEVDTEYKPGVDAARLDVALGDRTSLTAVGVAGELDDDHDLAVTVHGSAALARGKYRLDHGELGALGGWVRGDAVAGVDGTWDTGSFDLYGEATATLVTSRSLTSPQASSGDVVGKAAVGASFHPTSKLTLDPEVLYDGFGAWHPANYLGVALSGRVAVGEQTTAGRLYAGGVVDWEAHPLVHVVGVALANVRDPSALASVAISYSVAGNASAVLGAYVPIGRRPTTGGAGLPVPTSEYGLYPYFAFLELKAVL